MHVPISAILLTSKTLSLIEALYKVDLALNSLSQYGSRSYFIKISVLEEDSWSRDDLLGEIGLTDLSRRDQQVSGEAKPVSHLIVLDKFNGFRGYARVSVHP